MSDPATAQNAITFRVLGTPIPKARPRVANGRAYTPDTTVAWETQVAVAYNNAMSRHPFLAGMPLAVTIQVIAPGKGSWASIRGDVDNYAKAILDALNGRAFVDDIQIVDLRITKRRVMRGEFPGAVVSIRPADPALLNLI